jgi:very-short-patch-repair endonuclease
MTKLYNRTSEKFKRQKLRTEMTEAEKRLWQHIRNRQLENCKFRRQYSVAAFAIDFYSPEIKLALEVDGDSHFVDGAVEYDAERQEFIESARINFLRFTNEEVYHNLDGVLEVIVEGIKSLRTSGVLPPQPPLAKGGSKS